MRQILPHLLYKVRVVQAYPMVTRLLLASTISAANTHRRHNRLFPHISEQYTAAKGIRMALRAALYAQYA